MIFHDKTFLSLIDMIDASIYWKDINYKYLGCNQYMLKLLGFSNSSEIIGKTDYELLWSKFADKINVVDKLVMEDGYYFGEEMTLSFNREKRIFLSNKTRLLNDDDKIIGLIGVSIDVTDRIEKDQLKYEIERQKIFIDKKIKFKNFVEHIFRLSNSFKIDILNSSINKPPIKIVEADKKISLTKREQQILYYLSLNQSPKDIANILSILDNKEVKPSTINSIICKKLYIKFSVSSVSQLIEKATMLNLLPLLL